MSEGDGLGGNRDPVEQPLCLGCGHRRIYHFHAAKTRGSRTIETAVPCSLDGCGCQEYDPAPAADNGLTSGDPAPRSPLAP